MPYDADQISNLDTALDALDTPTTAEVLDVTEAYTGHLVAASAARRAIAGGSGGGSLATLSDVDLTGASTDDVLTKDAGGDWVAAAPSGGSQTVYVQSTDPGAVGEGMVWIDTSAARPTLRVRNDNDDAWLGVIIGAALEVEPDTDVQALSIRQPVGGTLAMVDVRDRDNDVALLVNRANATMGLTDALPSGFTIHPTNGLRIYADANNEGDGLRISPGTGDGNPKVGFFGHAAVARPTGVAVTAAGVHAALVSLGLITA